MQISIHKRRKILLHFLLGIGLPSLLLGYFALRGIQNDQALLEKERLNEHRAIAQRITKAIDEDISEVEVAFRDAMADHQELQHSAFLRSLGNLKNQQTLLEEVFLLESSGRIRLPSAKLLFLPDRSAQPLSTQPRPSSVLRAIQTGRQYEFQQNSYEKALTSYRQVFAQVSSRQVKGELLNAIARVQKKSDLFPDAMESYKKIIQEYSHIRTRSGMPWGLVAQLELGSLLLTINDPTSAVQTFIGLYQDLIHREWVLGKSQYEFFAQRVEESLDAIFSREALPAPMQSYQNTFRTLKGEEKKQREITEKLLIFQGNARQNLLAKIPTADRDIRAPVAGRMPALPAPERFALEIGGRTYLVSILGEVKRNGDRVGGILLNPEHLKANLLQPAMQQHVSSEGTHWIVRGSDGGVILKSDDSPPGTVTVKTGFIGNFPPWSLEFRQQDPRLLETLLTSRRGIYLYMFILLAGILIFGLTLTIRIVTHELELGRMKSDFVSTISHEFKSPLTSIRQLAEMLQAGRVPSEDRRQRYYDVLLQQSERLSLLIDNILDFAKMEEGRETFEFERVDIGPLLQEIASAFQHRVRHEGFAVQAEIGKPLPSIQADRGAITQAITNLIDNAIKYSGEAKEVYVRAFTEDQHLIIAVQDFGVGIKQEEISKVFERFYRGGDELTRTAKGSGLGLTLVKQIVEAHHGTVHIESEPGRGSTFSIRLPVDLKEE